MVKADMLLVNGNVITMESMRPKAEAVAVRNGRIMYVGDAGEADGLKGKDTEMVDLQGKTLMPGFIESHMHPLLFGTSLLEVDCRAPEVDSLDILMQRVREAAQKTSDGDWIRGWGWDDSKLKERRSPTRWDLDKVSPNHPVYLKRTCGHVAAVNTRALELGGITGDTPDPEGGHIVKDPDTGEPTGILHERAQEYIKAPAYTFAQYEEGILLAQKELARWGITTVHDIAGEPKGFRVFQNLMNNNNLDVRVRFWFFAQDMMSFPGSLNDVIALGIKGGFGNSLLNFQGMKFLLDGSGGGRTAAVAEPYEGEADNCGILYCTEEGITPDVIRAVKAGLRVAIHAIGERAIEVALNAIEAAVPYGDLGSMRHRIEHCGLPTEAQISRIKDMEIIAASSIGFVYSLGDSHYRNLGPERMKRAYPHRTYMERGIVAPGNSDCPVCNGNPMWGIYGAVTRTSVAGQVLDTAQNIPVDEALKLFTTHAAYSSFEENTLGSIKEGKLADMIVLSENPLQVPSEALKDIEVECTIMNGRITFQK